MEWIIIIGLIILFIYVHRTFKFPKTACVSLVTGGVKSGKSTFALALARKEYKRNLRHVKFVNFFRKIFRKELLEEPLFYSNIKHPFPYVQLTSDLLLRKKRFRYGSIVYISEASLVADSMCWKDDNINDTLMYFNKLIGHELGPGGKLIYDTQCINDLHFSIERCLSNYYYVHHTIQWIPFFLVAFVRENVYSADGSTLNVFDDDVEQKLKKVLIPKRVWKDFDAWCYSAMTDDLPVEEKNVKYVTLKVKKPLRFRDILPNCFARRNSNEKKKS